MFIDLFPSVEEELGGEGSRGDNGGMGWRVMGDDGGRRIGDGNERGDEGREWQGLNIVYAYCVLHMCIACVYCVCIMCATYCRSCLLIHICSSVLTLVGRQALSLGCA